MEKLIESVIVSFRSKISVYVFNIMFMFSAYALMMSNTASSPITTIKKTQKVCFLQIKAVEMIFEFFSLKKKCLFLPSGSSRATNQGVLESSLFFL